MPLVTSNASGGPATSVNLEVVELDEEEEDDPGDRHEEKTVSPATSSHGIRSLLRKSSIIDVIPKEAESLTVMVGAIKFLEKPITVFVRLRQVRKIKLKTVLINFVVNFVLIFYLPFLSQASTFSSLFRHQVMRLVRELSSSPS